MPEQSKRRERATHKPDQRSNSQHPFPIRPFQPISPIFCNRCSDVRWERCTFCTVKFLGGAGRRTHVDRFLRRLSTPMAPSAINLPNILFQTTTIKASCARNSLRSKRIIKAYLGTDVVDNINLRKSLSRRRLLKTGVQLVIAHEVSMRRKNVVVSPRPHRSKKNLDFTNISYFLTILWFEKLFNHDGVFFIWVFYEPFLLKTRVKPKHINLRAKV